jgi:hypothetical protein
VVGVSAQALDICLEPRRTTTHQAGRCSLPPGALVVTSSNAVREALTASVVAEAATQGRQVVRLLATCTRTGAGGGSVADKLMRWLHHTATEATTDKLPPVLDVFVGQRVRVVRNVATKLGVANGTLGTVHRVVWRGLSAPGGRHRRRPAVPRLRGHQAARLHRDHCDRQARRRQSSCARL